MLVCAVTPYAISWGLSFSFWMMYFVIMLQKYYVTLMTLKNLIQYQSIIWSLFFKMMIFLLDLTSVSKPSPVSTSIANYETISTVSDNITVLVEALTTTCDVSLTTYKATRTLTESVNTVIYDSSFVANTELYTSYNWSTTGVETHVPQSSFISSDLDNSMQASLLTTNSSVSMDLLSNNTAVTVSDTTAASIEGASTTTGILATAFDSATSNTGSINSLIIHALL